MRLKTKNVIMFGIILVVLHFVLMIIGYGEFLETSLGLNYIGIMSLFMIVWGCSHLLIFRLLFNNPQVLMAQYKNQVMKQSSMVKQYYQTDLSKEDVKNNLLMVSKKKDVRSQIETDGNITLSKEIGDFALTCDVTIRLLSNENQQTVVATEVRTKVNDYVSRLKIFTAGLLFVSTFFGFVSFLFAIVIHMTSMYEIFRSQQLVRSHLSNLDEMIELSVKEDLYE